MAPDGADRGRDRDGGIAFGDEYMLPAAAGSLRSRPPFGTFGTTFPSSFAGGTIKPSQLPCGHPPKDKIAKNFFLHVHINAIFSINIVEGTSL